MTAALGQVPAGEIRPARRYQVLPTEGGCFECAWQAAGRDYQVTFAAKAHVAGTGHQVKVITAAMVIWEPLPPGGPPPPARPRPPRGSHRKHHGHPSFFKSRRPHDGG